MRFIFITICFLFPCFYLQAQTHVISLSQSRQSALAHSYAVKNGQLKINYAEADVAAAHSNYLPSVNAQAFGLYNPKNFVDSIPVLLPENINNFYAVSLSGLETIYAGGKVRTGNKLAALQLEVNKILATQSEDSVLLQTEQKYWSIVNLQEQKKTLLANIVYLTTLLKQQQDLLDAGLIARNDLLKVKVQKSQLQLNESKLESARKVALLDFSLYTGLPFDTLMIMQDSLNKQTLPTLPIDGPDTSLSGNKNYQLLSKSAEAQKLQTKLTRGDNLPSISAGAAASETGIIGRGIGSTFVPVLIATVSIPISDGWWGKNKYKIRQSLINENIAQNNLEDGRNQLTVGIVKSWYDMTDALKQIVFAKENVLQAAENLKVNQDNYASGLAAISEVLDAQAAYQRTLDDEVSAYTDFESKKAWYYYFIGDIKNKP